MRQRLVKWLVLCLGLSSSSELEESSLEKSRSLRAARSGHHLLELLLLLVPEVELLLVIALAVVVPLGVVILVGGVELLPLGQSVMKWVVSLHLKHPLGDLLSLQNLCKARNFLTSRAISSSGMLSYCSSEATHKEDKGNSKADESVALVGLATWPPTRAPVIKALLENEAS
jgi:hypothetical protein